MEKLTRIHLNFLLNILNHILYFYSKINYSKIRKKGFYIFQNINKSIKLFKKKK